MKENRVLGDVLAYLESRPDLYAWRNNTGGAWQGKRYVSYGQRGSADILCCWRGRLVAIECKATKGRQSPIQEEWQHRIERVGAAYVLARSVQDVRAFFLKETQ